MFYTAKQTHTRSINGKVHANAWGRAAQQVNVGTFRKPATRSAIRQKAGWRCASRPTTYYAFGLKRSSRLALLTTVMEESAIAAPATTGLSSVPVRGHKMPVAIGIPSEL